MKAIHSFWFKPFHEARERRPLGGYNSERHFWYSWVLSFFAAKKHHKNIELVTDKIGYRNVVDILKLPYSNVSTKFEELDNINTSFWCYGKLLTYAAQTRPFLHLDIDAFLWKELPADLLNSPVFAQSLENRTDQRTFYIPLLNNMREHLAWLPDSYYTLDPDLEGFYAVNCGIFGGNNLKLIREYANESIKIFTCPENEAGWNKLAQIKDYHLSWYNCAVEQVNLVLVCQLHGVKLSYLLEDAFALENPEQVMNYSHLVGVAKQIQSSLDNLERLMSIHFSELKKVIDRNFTAECK